MRWFSVILLVAGCKSTTCTVTGDCSKGQVCSQQVCLSPECMSDAECARGQRCVGLRCAGDAMPEICGDGVVVGAEQCDDGNRVGNDYCAPDCLSQTGSRSDGVVQPNEVCDDSNDVDNDYCSNDRQTARRCGDTLTQTNEACDDGNRIDTDYCSNDCLVSHRCGDGSVQSNEACDDGNRTDNDYCTNDCSAAFACGDGLRQAGIEACDEGTTRSTPNCTGCVAASGTCGNGALDAGESCDASVSGASGYCHQCKAGTGCLGGVNNGCANNGSSDIGTGGVSGATNSTGCVGSFVEGFDFTVSNDASLPIFTGMFSEYCRAVDTSGVVGATSLHRSFYSEFPAGCGSTYAPFAKHVVRCPQGQLAAGVRGYEVRSTDGLTAVGFVVPLCISPTGAKAFAPPFGRREPAEEIYGPVGATTIATNPTFVSAVGTARALSTALSPLDSATIPASPTARRVDFYCPQGQAVDTYIGVLACYGDSLKFHCSPLP